MSHRQIRVFGQGNGYPLPFSEMLLLKNPKKREWQNLTFDLCTHEWKRLGDLFHVGSTSYQIYNLSPLVQGEISGEEKRLRNNLQFSGNGLLYPPLSFRRRGPGGAKGRGQGVPAHERSSGVSGIRGRRRRRRGHRRLPGWSRRKRSRPKGGRCALRAHCAYRRGCGAWKPK